MSEKEKSELVRKAHQCFKNAEITAKKGQTTSDLREIRQLLTQLVFQPPELIFIFTGGRLNAE